MIVNRIDFSMDSNKDAIRVNNLTREYNDTTVLAGVNLIIREGEFYALMGPNGSGKTTLTSIIACVRRPSSGNVEIYTVNRQIKQKISLPTFLKTISHHHI